jgi:hypothetical protein
LLRGSVYLGVLWGVFWGISYVQITFGRLWHGFTPFYLAVMIYTWWELQQFVGQFGNLETK